jgi:hypothetical protein
MSEEKGGDGLLIGIIVVLFFLLVGAVLFGGAMLFRLRTAADHEARAAEVMRMEAERAVAAERAARQAAEAARETEQKSERATEPDSKDKATEVNHAHAPAANEPASESPTRPPQ